MTHDPQAPDDPREDQLIDELAAYDEALARGESPAEPERTALLSDELRAARECVDLLERLWPRRPAPAEGLPRRLGRFEVLGELGRGGCGVVLLALDPVLGRRVALKVPRPEALLTPELRQRF